MQPDLDEAIRKVESTLDEVFPSPEDALNRLASRFGLSPDQEPYVTCKRLVVDIEDLTCQVRWHLAHALLLRHLFPECVSDIPEEIHEFARDGIPAMVPLLLRPYVMRADKVLYNDLTELRRGVPVAGWVFHMLIDGSLYRIIAVLDRIARLLSLLANYNPPRIYFRSANMRAVKKRLPEPETNMLSQIAESEIYQLALEYRDGLTHTRKPQSILSGGPLIEVFRELDKTEAYRKESCWTPSYLLALLNGTYQQMARSLFLMAALSERLVPLRGRPAQDR